MTLISGLQIGKQIGKGQFGEVFLGTDPVHGQVAAKILRRKTGETDAAWTHRKAALLKEAVLIKKATHRNVVPVFHLLESDVDDSILYVMEYCKNGCLLKSYESGPLSLREVREIGTSVSLGLAELHSKEIIHRDIKPSNILCFDSTCKLSDFGLATDDIILGYASAAGYCGWRSKSA